MKFNNEGSYCHLDGEGVMEKKIKKNVLIDAIIVIFVSVLFLFLLNYNNHKFLCVTTFLLNGCTIIYFTIESLNQSNISLELVYWVFQYIFMFFAPLVQYSYGDFPWYNWTNHSNILILANILILLWNLIFWTVTKYNIQKNGKLKRNLPGFFCDSEETACINISKYLCVVVTMVSCLITIQFVIRNGISNIFMSSRNTDFVTAETTNSSFALLSSKFLDAWVNITAIFNYLYYRKTGKKKLFIISIVCVIIYLFPTRLSRYMIAVVYLGLLLLCSNWIKRKSHFFWIYLLSFLIIFPLLENFRYKTLAEVNILDSLKYLFTNFFRGYLGAHYDAYSMLCSVLKYLGEYGSTYCHQLLGVFLFFIPRNIWKTKPFGSGYMISKALHYSFNNVSCPLIGEFLINFGYVGVIIGAIIFGYIVKTCDRYFSDINKSGIRHSEYCIIIAFMAFILRGDLLSSFAYIMAYIIVYEIFLAMNNRFFIKEHI